MTQNNCKEFCLIEVRVPLRPPSTAVPHVPDVRTITRFSKRSIDQTTGKKNRSVETSHKQRRRVKTLQMTVTMIHEGETMKQMSWSTCPVTVVLSKQATHAPRLTLQTLAPCWAKKSSQKSGIISDGAKSGPCGPDVHGAADDADFTRRNPIRSAPHGDRLDLALVGRQPFGILPLGELSIPKSGHTAAKGSDHVVL